MQRESMGIKRTFASDLLDAVPTYSKLNKIYDSLEEVGYIEIIGDIDNSKRRIVQLTNKGRLFVYCMHSTMALLYEYDETMNSIKLKDEKELEPEKVDREPMELKDEPITEEEYRCIAKDYLIMIETLEKRMDYLKRTNYEPKDINDLEHQMKTWIDELYSGAMDRIKPYLKKNNEDPELN